MTPERRVYAGIYALVALVLLIAFRVKKINAAEMPTNDKPKEELALVKNSGFYFIPMAYYKPETRIAGGAVFITYFRRKGDPEPETDGSVKKLPIDVRASSIATTLTYTQNKQVIWQFYPELYLDNERYHVMADTQYLYYPNRFYGIGNDTPGRNKEDYTSELFSNRSDLQRKFAPGLYLGIVHQYQWNRLREYEENGQLAPPSISNRLKQVEEDGRLDMRAIPGTKEGRASGTGVSVSYDYRDNVQSARSGGFYQLSAVRFDGVFGSDYNFTDINIELRQYVPLWRDYMIGFHYYMNTIFGKAPFEMLSMLGGRRLMRGIYEGRYRDNHSIIAQVEYRMPLVWRFSLAAFASVGDVAHEMEDFDIKEFKIAYGGGLRFDINPVERIRARIDVGRSESLTAFYVTIGEAF